METVAALKSLGLEGHEPTVYHELLKLGTTTVGPLVKNLGIHRQLVYLSLDALEQKGLASHVIRRGRKNFTAARPQTLLKMQEEKQRLAVDLLPVLEQLRSASGLRLEVRVLYGPEEFYNNLEAVIESAARFDRTVRIIGGARAEDFYDIVGGRYENYLTLSKRARIKKLMIAPRSCSKLFQERFAAEPTDNILKLLSAGLSSPTYTRITPELTTFEIYSSDVVTIQIWNASVAAGYLEHFNLLWKSAKLYSA